MKSKIKLIVLSILLITLNQFVYCQVKFGFKVGLNFSNVRETRSDTSSFVTGNKWAPSFHMGGFMQISLSDRISLMSDLLISDKGFKNDFNRNHFLYLTALFQLRYKLAEKLSVEGGPGVSGLLTAFRGGEGDRDLTDTWTNRIDWEVSVGFSYAVTDRASLSLRYEHGLSDVIGKDGVGTTLTIVGGDPIRGLTLRERGIKNFNQNIQLSVAYMLSRR